MADLHLFEKPVVAGVYREFDEILPRARLHGDRSALVAVHDEEFWARFGGQVEANWESAGLRRFSSMDPKGLSKLIVDPAWSDEGLFALVLGLRRLAELDPSRVELSQFQIGVLN
jgi:hypothetical protein